VRERDTVKELALALLRLRGVKALLRAFIHPGPEMPLPRCGKIVGVIFEGIRDEE
jgi:hypothetical protein